MKRAIAIAWLFLAACERVPEAPTAAENKQLDEMENALDDEAARAENAS